MFRHDAKEVLNWLKTVDTNNETAWVQNNLLEQKHEQEAAEFSLVPLSPGKKSPFEKDIETRFFGTQVEEKKENQSTISINNEPLDLKDKKIEDALSLALGKDFYDLVKRCYVQEAQKIFSQLVNDFALTNGYKLGTPDVHFNFNTTTQPAKLEISLSNIPITGTEKWFYTKKGQNEFAPLHISDPVSWTFDIDPNNKCLKFKEIVTTSPLIEAFLKKDVNAIKYNTFLNRFSAHVGIKKIPKKTVLHYIKEKPVIKTVAGEKLPNIQSYDYQILPAQIVTFLREQKLDVASYTVLNGEAKQAKFKPDASSNLSKDLSKPLHPIQLNGLELDCLDSTNLNDFTRLLNFSNIKLGLDYDKAHLHYHATTFPVAIFDAYVKMHPVLSENLQLSPTDPRHNLFRKKVNKKFVTELHALTEMKLINYPQGGAVVAQLPLMTCYRLSDHGFELIRIATPSKLLNEFLTANSQKKAWINKNFEQALKWNEMNFRLREKLHDVLNPNNDSNTDWRAFFDISDKVLKTNKILQTTSKVINFINKPFVVLKNSLNILAQAIPMFMQVCGEFLVDRSRSHFNYSRISLSRKGMLLAACGYAAGTLLAGIGAVTRYAIKCVVTPIKAAREANEIGLQSGQWFGSTRLGRWLDFSDENAKTVGQCFRAASVVISTLAYTGLALLALPALPAVGTYLAAKGTFTATISTWFSNVGTWLGNAFGFNLLGAGSAQATGIGISATAAVLAADMIGAIPETVNNLKSLAKTSPRTAKSPIESTATTVKGSSGNDSPNSDGSSPEHSPRSNDSGENRSARKAKVDLPTPPDSDEEVSPPPGSPANLRKTASSGANGRHMNGGKVSKFGKFGGTKSKTPSPPPLDPVPEHKAPVPPLKLSN